MTKEFVLNIFKEQPFISSFARVNSLHPLDIYLGWDEYNRPTLLIICNEKLNISNSTELIKVNCGKRKDEKWAISMSLSDEKNLDIFCAICADLISYTNTAKDKNTGARMLINRYSEWINLLKKSNGDLLSYSEIKGLIGELIFLKDYLAQLYDMKTAINSWIGPKYSDQDFVCFDTWYEVKSTVTGSPSVRISSIEQLDTIIDGHLIITFLDSTSTLDENKINLNKVTEEIENLIDDDDVIRRFRDMLLFQGYYPNEAYNDINFKLTSVEEYDVNKNFPCLRKEHIPNSVSKVKYDLIINTIERFKGKTLYYGD